MQETVNIKDFITEFKEVLSEKVIKKLNPVYNPESEDEFDKKTEKNCARLLRQLFPNQLLAAKALVKGLKKENRKNLFLTAEMGCGKTIMAIATAVSLKKRPRVLVACPPHLVNKWIREIKQTVRNAEIYNLNTQNVISQLLSLRKLKKRKIKPSNAEFYIIGRERMKQRYGWKPAYIKRTTRKTNPETGKIEETVILLCPNCGKHIIDEKHISLSEHALAKKKHFCIHCKNPLFEADRNRRRHAEPAWFIKKYLKNFFDLAVFDEAHELKGENTNQGNAFGSIASATPHTLCLTGTLMGGYADNLFYLLYRTDPSLMAQDFRYKTGTGEWTAKYGVLETVTIEKQDEDNVYGRGGKTYTRIRKKPGISPEVLAKYLLDRSVFMRLTDICNELPEYNETVISINMHEELRDTYNQLKENLITAVTKALRGGSRRLLGAYLQALLAYPDACRKELIITDPNNKTKIIADAPALIVDKTEKEKELLEIVKKEKQEKRNCLIYCTYTHTHDVTHNLKRLLEENGINTFILSQNISTSKREQWIKDKVKQANGYVCMICNPELVKTGLDLIEFPTVIYYQTGYSIYTLRQAARRTWRIGQDKDVRVYYLVYRDSMQETAMRLIATKLETSLAIEGDLTDRGLVALSEAGEGLIYELARTLINNIHTPGSLDYYWKDYRKTEAETDSYLTPKTIRAFSMDRRKTVTLEQAGDKIIWIEIRENKRRKKRSTTIKVKQGELEKIARKTGQTVFQLTLPMDA